MYNNKSSVRALALQIATICILVAGAAHAGSLGTGTYRCTVGINPAFNDCTDGIVTVTASSGSERLVQIDLNQSFAWASVNAIVDYCNPTGWTVNIGDSPTNNGGGGDGISTRHDAESQMVGTTMSTFFSDVGGTGLHSTIGDAMPSSGCFTVQWTVTQDQVSFDDDGDTADSPRITAAGSLASGTQLFDFPPYNEADSEDSAGTYADKLFVGLNRVVAATAGRTGTGVQSVCFFLSTSASPNPATIAAECGL